VLPNAHRRRIDDRLIVLIELVARRVSLYSTPNPRVSQNE